MPTATLTRQRCYVHAEREAAARCPVCTRFFCRECVTEHEGRIICAGCLRAAVAEKDRRKQRGRFVVAGRTLLAGGVRVGQLAASVVLAWVFFQMLGDWLLRTATEFHQGNLWKEQFYGGGSNPDEDINPDERDPLSKRNRDDKDQDKEDDKKDQLTRRPIPVTDPRLTAPAQSWLTPPPRRDGRP